MAEGALSGFLTNVGTVFTSLVGWMGSIGSTILSTPVLFVPCVIGFAFVAVGLFKSIRG
jgi:hypothetical protein